MSVSGPANTQREAKQNWTSAYPFEVSNGGTGVGIDATTSSDRVALPSGGSALELNNEEGLTSAYFQWGDSSVAATNTSYRVGPGISKLVSIAEGEAPTHIACLMASGSARVMIYRGHGN